MLSSTIAASLADFPERGRWIIQIVCVRDPQCARERHRTISYCYIKFELLVDDSATARPSHCAARLLFDRANLPDCAVVTLSSDDVVILDAAPNAVPVILTCFVVESLVGRTRVVRMPVVQHFHQLLVVIVGFNGITIAV